ncbi:hypothetical protein HPB47_024800 [Ixodes persulcatus]|uniref:Uncharacterized protein n=1 Tax=Ixodes persulcatus TaxID=34615 RepID=A0AC60Q5L6_IXOPE|nr:hypothetical protein HPB47_024800 [Ixodes persulcatus]
MSRLTTGLKAPSGKGERVIVTHAGSATGFVSGCLDVFRGKKKGDYHDEMNSNRFEAWFLHLLDHIEPNSVIVIDNAPYHSRKAEAVPTTATKKGEIQQWLSSKNLDWTATMKKKDLLSIVATNLLGTYHRATMALPCNVNRSVSMDDAEREFCCRLVCLLVCLYYLRRLQHRATIAGNLLGTYHRATMALPCNVNRSVSMDDAEREFCCRLVCLLVCLYYLRRLQHRATIAGRRRNFLLRALKTVSTLDEEDVTRQIRTLIMYLADLSNVPALQVPGLTNDECLADSHHCEPLAVSPAVDVEEEPETVAATETPALSTSSSADIEPSLSPQRHGIDEKCPMESYHSHRVSATVDAEEEPETVSSTDDPTLCVEAPVDTTEPSSAPQRHATEETQSLSLQARSATCRTTDPLELPTALETTGPHIFRAAASIRVIRSWSAQHHRAAFEEHRRFSPFWTTPAAWHLTGAPPTPTDRSDPPLPTPAPASTSSMAAAGAWSRTTRPSGNAIGYARVGRRILLLGANPRVLTAVPRSINKEEASSTPEAADPSTGSPGAVAGSTVRLWLVQDPLGSTCMILALLICDRALYGSIVELPGFSLLAAPPPLYWIFPTLDTRGAAFHTRPPNGLDCQRNQAPQVGEWDSLLAAPPPLPWIFPTLDTGEADCQTTTFDRLGGQRNQARHRPGSSFNSSIASATARKRAKRCCSLTRVSWSRRDSPDSRWAMSSTTCRAVGRTSNPVRNPELRFHQFPRDRKRHKLWVGAVRRIDFGRPSTPNSNAKLCSQHFT